MNQQAMAYLVMGVFLFSLGMAVLVGAIVSGIVLDNPNAGAPGGAIGGFLLATGFIFLAIGVRKYE